MATYESLIKIKGAVGDLVFYNLNGKNVVRKKSGFNKTAFKKNPSYEKVRQNSSEFGHCSKIGKIIRLALDSYIKQAEAPLLYQSFAKLMTEIKDLDTVSGRGKRTVEKGIVTERGKFLLKKFQFGNKDSLGSDISISVGLWDKSLHVGNKYSADEVNIVTLKIDFENYITESFENTISIDQQKEILFEKHFPDDDFILHFIALRKNNEIICMGFI